jgi:hypothetical protein
MQYLSRTDVRFPVAGYCVVTDEKSLDAIFEQTWSVYNITYRSPITLATYRRTSGVLADIDRALMVRGGFVYTAEILELVSYTKEFKSKNATLITDARAKVFAKTQAGEFLRDVEKFKSIMGALEGAPWH